MAITRTNAEWLEQLRSSGPQQEAAIADLNDLLLRSVLYFFGRNLGDFERLTHDQVLQLAEDCAQDAVIAVMQHLSTFRGESRFTTWVYKFGINVALTASRRERWKAVSIDQVTPDGADPLSKWILEDRSSGTAPDQSAMQTEVRKAIREVIEQELTERQRRVLIMMVFDEVPMDEVARLLDTNRNAIYKMLHDARRKLKQRLQTRGFEVDEILNLFTVYR